jgi:Fur family transcriptional regulator, iron response regulator
MRHCAEEVSELAGSNNLHLQANMLQMQQSRQPIIGSVRLSAMTPTRTTVLAHSNETPTPSVRPALTGCPWHDVKAMLREVGLRPTRQRMALGWILFGKGDRHVTAEMLYEEALHAKVPVSLATIYNTLHQFTDVGLLRQVAVDGCKTYFDTNVSQHHHFFVEGENDLLDIPPADVVVGKTPVPPEGYEIDRIDVVVRLRKRP